MKRETRCISQFILRNIFRRGLGCRYWQASYKAFACRSDKTIVQNRVDCSMEILFKNIMHLLQPCRGVNFFIFILKTIVAYFLTKLIQSLRNSTLDSGGFVYSQGCVWWFYVTKQFEMVLLLICIYKKRNW